MSKILIVEDEPDMVLGLKDNFEFEGYEVTTAGDGQAGLEKVWVLKLDFIVLDVMLFKLSGLEVCKTLRGEGYEGPILMLTARGQEIDKVVGLELGADDYVTKPFSIRELPARVRAVLRRTEGKASGCALPFAGVELTSRPQGHQGRRDARAQPPGVRAAELPDREEGRHRDPRPAARGRVGLRELPVDPHRGHPHRQAAREDRRQRERAPVDPHHPRDGLQVHRPHVSPEARVLSRSGLDG
jgi:DNA-binding response OmpR family regulator